MLGLVAALTSLLVQGFVLPGGGAPALEKKPSAHRRATIAAVGDVMFGRYKLDDEGERNYRLVVKKGDAFAEVAPLLGAADLAFANVETPIMEEPETFSVHRMLTFRADPARAAELYHGGAIAYSLGNFVFDEGYLDRRQTIILHATLDGTGIMRRVTDVSLTPIMIGHHDHIPRPASGTDLGILRKKLAEIAPGIASRSAPDSYVRASR